MKASTTTMALLRASPLRGMTTTASTNQRKHSTTNHTTHQPTTTATSLPPGKHPTTYPTTTPTTIHHPTTTPTRQAIRGPERGRREGRCASGAPLAVVRPADPYAGVAPRALQRRADGLRQRAPRGTGRVRRKRGHDAGDHHHVARMLRQAPRSHEDGGPRRLRAERRRRPGFLRQAHGCCASVTHSRAECCASGTPRGARGRGGLHQDT